jgi:hypothetical protein
LEQEFDDESEDEDDGEYLFNETETTAIQEHSIQDIKWGQLDTDEIKYLPRRTFVSTDNNGVKFDNCYYTWSRIQALHGTVQRKNTKYTYFHWHGPNARCWCQNPLHAPTDQCYNCYSDVIDYVNCRLHMTNQQDQEYLEVLLKVYSGH